LPASLLATFNARRTAMMNRGWPAPPDWSPHRQDRRYYLAWLEYWSALEKRYTFENVTFHSRADIPPPPATP
jgi:hypothetical protein